MPLLAETSSLPAWGIVLAVAAVLAVWAAGVFNGLTRKRNGYRNAFAQIDVQLKRRYDLVPNLVETVKGYAKHERETLEAVVKARNVAAAAAEAAAKAAGDPDAMARLAHSEAALGGALSRLLVTVERYPDLKNILDWRGNTITNNWIGAQPSIPHPVPHDSDVGPARTARLETARRNDGQG